MKEIYDIVLKAQIKAIDEIKPGLTVKEEMHYPVITLKQKDMVSILAIH